MKKIYLILFVIILIVASFLLLKFYTPKIIHVNRPIACTMEAKLCPDGSAVGRTGPSCEFAPCPDTTIPPTPTSTTTPPITKKSGITGRVLLGPTCPVMKVGDTTCADRPYSTTIQVIAVGSTQSSPFTTVKSDSEGKFSVLIPPGKYALQPVGGQPLPRCETKEVIVPAEQIVEVDLSCDTGIR